MQLLITLFIIACVLTILLAVSCIWMMIDWKRKPKASKIPYVADQLLDHDMKETHFIGISNNIPALLSELDKSKKS